MHDIIFHFGWEMKSLHTIFSYIFTYLYNDTIFVKTLSTGYSRFQMIFMGVSIKILMI